MRARVAFGVHVGVFRGRANLEPRAHVLVAEEPGQQGKAAHNESSRDLSESPQRDWNE